MAAPTIDTIPRTLILSPGEANVHRLLVDVALEINKGKPEGESLVLRFTGGWVRDKLLGLPSADIDVGIQNMTGIDFATRVSKHISENPEKYGPKQGRVHKIRSNPKRSKHLETARKEVLGFGVDFVNLRSESYSGDSRIPHMVCSALPSTVSLEAVALMALGIWNPRRRRPPPRLHHQHPFLQPTH